MKIPTYQKSITHQRGHAQKNTPSQPVLKKDGVEQLQRQLAGQLMRAAGAEFLAIADLKRKEQSYEKEQEIKKSKEAKLSQSAQTGGFSSPKRQELYEFGKAQITAAMQQKSSSQNAAENAVEGFDRFFEKQVAENQADFSLQNPDQNLLAQDYSILRQEINHLQQAKNTQEQKEIFERSAGQFIQTAGLIRTPRALEQYVQDNLSAAKMEFLASNDHKSQDWQSQKNTLYTQAVAHNIEAALQAGEVYQARQTYEHFKEKLPQALQEILQTKVCSAQATETAQQLAPRIYEKCVSAQGDISLEDIAEQVHQYCPSHEAQEKQICQALQGCLESERNRRLQKESQNYLALLNSENDPAAARQIVTAWQGSAKQIQQAEKLALALQQPQKYITKPAVFNDLQYGIYGGQTDVQQIDAAFEAGDLSAADTLRLKSRYCKSRAAAADTKDKMLFRSVYRVCQQAGLELYATEEAVYSVFSSGEDAQTHWQAANELKKWLML